MLLADPPVRRDVLLELVEQLPFEPLTLEELLLKPEALLLQVYSFGLNAFVVEIGIKNIAATEMETPNTTLSFGTLL